MATLQQQIIQEIRRSEQKETHDVMTLASTISRDNLVCLGVEAHMQEEESYVRKRKEIAMPEWHPLTHARASIKAQCEETDMPQRKNWEEIACYVCEDKHGRVSYRIGGEWLVSDDARQCEGFTLNALRDGDLEHMLEDARERWLDQQ